ncbi:MAG: hypothetical protein LC776_09255, partial [Acidobacteria bacterium]|nr:hypothetical protein [Acidobacteriota bacterium]
DSPAPVARNVDGLGNLSDSFFDQQTIPVNDQFSPELTLLFFAREAAYSFVFEIEYTVGNKNYSQIVDLKGRPFKASADICMTQLLRTKLAASEVERLGKLRYQAVRVVDSTPTGFQY